MAEDSSIDRTQVQHARVSIGSVMALTSRLACSEMDSRSIEPRAATVCNDSAFVYGARSLAAADPGQVDALFLHERCRLFVEARQGAPKRQKHFIRRHRYLLRALGIAT